MMYLCLLKNCVLFVPFFFFKEKSLSDEGEALNLSSNCKA